MRHLEEQRVHAHACPESTVDRASTGTLARTVRGCRVRAVLALMAGLAFFALPLAAETLWILGGQRVDPATGRLSAPVDVVIEDDTIVSIVPAGRRESASADRVVDARGRYLLPGLIDVHAHLGDGGIGPQDDDDRAGALAQFLRYGVTTIFVPGGGGGNDDQLASWKARCRSGALVCPRLAGSGALITSVGGHPIGTIWAMSPDTDPAIVYARGAVTFAADGDAERLMSTKERAGVDAIKVVIEDWAGEVPRLTNPQLRRLTRAAHERDLRVFAHISTARHAADAATIGMDGVMHSSETPIPQPVLADMARQGMFYVATLSLYDGFFDRAQGQIAPEPYAAAGVAKRALASLDGFRASPFAADEVAAVRATILDNLRRAQKAGVPLALGTDVNNPSVFPGYAAHEELELMVEAGLSPARALVAATLGGAAFLGREADLGRIDPGFRADLIVLDRNPLEAIMHTRSIHAVIWRGQPVYDVVAWPPRDGSQTAAPKR